MSCYLDKSVYLENRVLFSESGIKENDVFYVVYRSTIIASVITSLQINKAKKIVSFEAKSLDQNGINTFVDKRFWTNSYGPYSYEIAFFVSKKSAIEFAEKYIKNRIDYYKNTITESIDGLERCYQKLKDLPKQKEQTLESQKTEE